MIGEISRLLPPGSELQWTTDPDRIVDLAGSFGAESPRPSVRAARQGLSREEVVVELAREVDRLQVEDRARMRRYEAAARPYQTEFRATVPEGAPLEDAHEIALGLAERLLPARLDEGGT